MLPISPSPETPRVERGPGRLTAFSDGVFAISVTLLVLGINPPSDFHHLLSSLGARWPSFAAYAISFMLVGQVWVNHHVMFDHIRHVDHRVLFLNTLLLMDIAFLPFSTSVLAEAFRSQAGLRTAVILYGITLWTAALLFNIIWAHLRWSRLFDSSIEPAAIRAIGHRFAFALLWIGGGVVLGAVVPLAGVVIIAAFLPAYYLPIRGEYGQPGEGGVHIGRRR